MELWEIQAGCLQFLLSKWTLCQQRPQSSTAGAEQRCSWINIRGMYVLAHATKACSSGDSRRLILFPPPHSSPSGPRIVLILSFGGNEAVGVGSVHWNPALVPRKGACRIALPPLHHLILNGALRGTLIQPRISYPAAKWRSD